MADLFTLGPELAPGQELARGDCEQCGGQCDGDDCGLHAAGCVFGGTGGGYWLIANGCELDQWLTLSS